MRGFVVILGDHVLKRPGRGGCGPTMMMRGLMRVAVVVAGMVLMRVGGGRDRARSRSRDSGSGRGAGAVRACGKAPRRGGCCWDCCCRC